MVTSLLVTPVSGNGDHENGNTLLAHETTATITLDGLANEAAWDTATALTVGTLGGVLNSDVTVKALYDGTNLYMLFVWTDTSRSDLEKAWIYDAEGDGGNGSWSYVPNDRTGDGKHSEDRLAVNWELGTVTDYDTKGCNVLCHGDRMHTAEGSGEKTDEWHWKASRSNYIGIAHDKWVDDTVDAGDVEAAHHGDGGSWYHTNANGTGPKYFEPGATGEDARFITQAEIDNGEAILVDGNETQLVDNMVVPGRYLDESEAVGDVADVKAKGVHDGSKWTLELKRKLDTGSENDVKFVEYGSYHFGIGQFDDQGHEPQHSYSLGTYTLKVGQKEDTTTKEDPGFLSWLAVGALGVTALGLAARRPKRLS